MKYITSRYYKWCPEGCGKSCFYVHKSQKFKCFRCKKYFRSKDVKFSLKRN